MRHLEGREVRGGGGLLEELGGGVEQLRPAAHLRVSSAIAADAGHRRRRWRCSRGAIYLRSGAALELGFWEWGGKECWVKWFGLASSLLVPWGFCCF